MIPTLGGMIYETSPDDFVLGATAGEDVSVLIKARAKQDDIIYEKNQARDKRFYFTCTITSAILAICDLFNEPITDDELNSICEEAITLGLDPVNGWSFKDAVNLARNFWNRTRPTKRVISFRLEAGSSQYFTALSYGYSLVSGYQGNADYNADRRLDGVVDGKEFPRPTYSHCIRKVQNGGIKVIDNYIGVEKYNIYTLKHPNELQDNGVFYPSHYVFLRESDLTQSQLDRLEGKKKGLWSGDRENEPITRFECATMASRAMSPETIRSIWNGLNPDNKCTRYEASQMIWRALGKEIVIAYPDNLMTRGETIELIVRTLRTK